VSKSLFKNCTHRKGHRELFQKVSCNVVFALQEAHRREEDKEDGDGEARLVQEHLFGDDAENNDDIWIVFILFLLACLEIPGSSSSKACVQPPVPDCHHVWQHAVAYIKTL